MAQTGNMANLEARLTTLGCQVEQLAQMLERVPRVSSEISTLYTWQDELSDFTAKIKQTSTELSSFRERWHDATIVKSEDVTRLERREEEIKMKEELLEQEAAEITKREKLLEQRTADLSKGQELLEQKAAEMTKREELLEQRAEEMTKRGELLDQMAAEMTKRGELLDQETRAINEREEIIRRREETFEPMFESFERHQQEFHRLRTALRSGVSSPALNPTPATRQDLTVNPSPDTLVPPGQGVDPATNPSGLSVASEHVRNVWRQIEFPADWTTADSDQLLAKFNEAKERKPGKNNRYWPQQAMDMGSKSTQPYCLLKDLKRAGMLAPQDDRRCESHASDDLCINVFYSTGSPGEYNSASTDKRWRLEKRQ